MTRYLYRVTWAAGSRCYQSREAAEDRSLRLIALGYAPVIERSDPITWPTQTAPAGGPPPAPSRALGVDISAPAGAPKHEGTQQL